MPAVCRPPASPSSSAALHRRPPLPRPVFGLPRSLFFIPSPLRKTRIRCSSQRQALFNRIAPIYDDLNDLLSLGLHRSWKRMCISWSGAKKGDRALDLCCGSGDLTFLLSQKVCGLDFSREQLSIASVRQDLYWKASYQNIQWIEGDALDLPFSDCYFDAITMGYGLRNLVDRQKALREIFRVLKPGSKVSILDFNKSTSSLINTAQEWMLDNVVVPVASTYGLSQEYKYLKGSIAEFLTGKELEKLVDEIGFSKARHYEIGGGFMGNLVATK
ncbi:2-phytyl-1,4-beta-naphthoquinone methyltransferase, chloroplastic isoform X2 [Curcuma longa]|uniref:2-phytyl-1,4-beta-naphthoquinone methyltransferase, chloroplastic isoform X2 n=1 Tax=Curcuma longa TaxID=136217 RepID=UPI003D9F09FF